MTKKLIYQIYPTAFGEDGDASLKEIASKIALLSELGLDYIWLSPIFVSSWADGGYDVADYCEINSRFGTMEDFEDLIVEAEKYDIGIMLDLVMNHTSIEHEWFQRSRRRDPEYEDFYIWRKKPNNWKSVFSGSAWEYDEVREEYYLHIFAKEQADLNYRNPAVLQKFDEVIDFWIAKGVKGFRFDTVNTIFKRNLRNGVLPVLTGFFGYYQNAKTVEILNNFLGQKSEIFKIAELTGGHFLSRKKFRQLTERAFNGAFNVGVLDYADTFFSSRDFILPFRYKKWLKNLVKWSQVKGFTMALESHDAPRSVNRFYAHPKALAALMFLLPSSHVCIYQGQEIGAQNPELVGDEWLSEDVQAFQSFQAMIARGKARDEALKLVRHFTRINARKSLNWDEYRCQMEDDDSVHRTYVDLARLWREDSVVRDGAFKLRKITRDGEIYFSRSSAGVKYDIVIDLKNGDCVVSEGDVEIFRVVP